MKAFLLCVFLLAPSYSFSKVVPVGVGQGDIKEVSKKLSGLFSLYASNNPKVIGSDFEFEVSAFYQDLEANELLDFQSDLSSDFLDSIVTLKKGMYWNIDVAISSALPIRSNLTSGYSFNIGHTSKIGSLIIKPELYISHYNLNDILSIETSGLAVVLYKQIGPLSLGIGGRIESISSTYENSFLGQPTLSSTGDNETSFTQGSFLGKVSFQLGNFSNITMSYGYVDENNSSYGLSLGRRF